MIGFSFLSERGTGPASSAVEQRPSLIEDRRSVMFKRSNQAGRVPALHGLDDRNMTLGRVVQVLLLSAVQNFEAMVVDQAAQQQRLNIRQLGLCKQPPVKLSVRLSQRIFIIGRCRSFHSGELCTQGGREIGGAS